MSSTPPAEFALDHVPGAVNLPVLTNEERAAGRNIYVQSSRVRGAPDRRRLRRPQRRPPPRDGDAGLAGAAKILVYCWRGGMRSNAMATILANVGWRTATLAGGYRTYRRRVTGLLYGGELALPKVVLLDGGTGSGKTQILDRLACARVQTLDLEGLAEHRGSCSAPLPGQPQPSQPMFESRLLAALEALDPARPVVVEAGVQQGRRPHDPAGAVARDDGSAEDRGRRLAEDRAPTSPAYADIADDREKLKALLARLPDRPGRKRLEAWSAMVEAGEFEALAHLLIEPHYDPAYRRWTKKRGDKAVAQINLSAVDACALDRAAQDIAALAVVRGA